MIAKRLTFWLAVILGLIGPIALSGIGKLDTKDSFSLIAISLWLLSPYALLAMAGRYAVSPIVTYGTLALTIIVGGWGSACYLQTTPQLAAKEPAAAGWTFILIPGMQLGIIIVSLVCLFVVGWLQTRRK